MTPWAHNLSKSGLYLIDCKSIFGSDRSPRNANVRPSGTNLSRAVNLHLSRSESTQRAIKEHLKQSESTQRAESTKRAIISESYHRSLKYCVLFINVFFCDCEAPHLFSRSIQPCVLPGPSLPPLSSSHL